jgi:hypothetical protein
MPDIIHRVGINAPVAKVYPEQAQRGKGKRGPQEGGIDQMSYGINPDLGVLQ